MSILSEANEWVVGRSEAAKTLGISKNFFDKRIQEIRLRDDSKDFVRELGITKRYNVKKIEDYIVDYSDRKYKERHGKK